jgi:hypothetical protein
MAYSLLLERVGVAHRVYYSGGDEGEAMSNLTRAQVEKMVEKLLPSHAREQPYTDQVWPHDVVTLILRIQAAERARRVVRTRRTK